MPMTPAAHFDPHRLRSYQPKDLPAVLAFVGECNARSGGCGYLHPGDIVHLMSNALRGRELDRHLHLYMDADDALGALAVIYPARDAAYDLIIHPDARGELERGLVEWCEGATAALLRAAKSDASSVSIDVTDCDRARRELLIERGYAPGTHVMHSTTRSLEGPIPPSILPEGFSIRNVAGEHEVDAVCTVHNGSFTPKWSHDEYLAVMRTPGFAVERELVVVAPDGRFAAFLVYWLDPISRSGLFEPVGCHREFQRHGLAKALMYEGMRRMVAAGMRSAIVLHNADNPPAVALYRSAGFRTAYTIADFRKPLTS
jgi:ribosomal protein S18 acetylase RimI-like enzyme